MVKSTHTDAYRSLIAGLAQARIDAGLTQQDVANSLGKPQSYIAKVESCERRLDVIEYFDIALAVSIDPLPMLETIWLDYRES